MTILHLSSKAASW